MKDERIESFEKASMDENYMSRCLELARCGQGSVSPNPMVGSIIVCDNKIIGEGYHRQYGNAHAEVNAVNSVKEKSLLKRSTIYVNLEPCSHHGKTPPCADMIIREGIPNVVVGMVDVFSDVSGRGIFRMEEAGINLRIGVLEEECLLLNKRFICYHEKKRPYIILKWAQSADGLLDHKRKSDNERKPSWINDEKELILVHKWRTEEQAIMVGTNTAINDNPKLNARLWKGKNPLRVVLDRTLRIQPDSSLFDRSIPTLVFTERNKSSTNNLEYCKIDFTINVIDQVLEQLYKRGIQSVLVEGGAMLLHAFIESNQWDEARVFRGKNNFDEGTKAPIISSKLVSQDILTSTYLSVYRNPQQEDLLPQKG